MGTFDQFDLERVSELAADIEFGTLEQHLLALARPLMDSVYGVAIDRFYAVLVQNPRTREVFQDQAQIERQKEHLADWMRGLFGGTYDRSYWERRARIGRTHVRIELDQRYMVSMMGVVRSELTTGLQEAAAGEGWSAEQTASTVAALGRLLDLELAVMLGTYQAAFIARIRAMERLGTLGQVSATIGHELRNPLAVIDSSLHLLRRRLPTDDERVAKHLDRIGGQVRIANAIITDLLEMAKDRPPDRAPVDVSALVKEAVELIRAPGDVRFDIAASVPAPRVDRGHLRQLFANLMQNAIEAGAETVRVSAASEGGDLVVSVEDDGEGLPAGAEDWMFQPLETGREKGVGLGLALCSRIVDKHDGRLSAHRLPRGTRLEAVFGRAYEPTEPEA